MSKDNTRQSLQSESSGSLDDNRKPWNYPDPCINIPQTPHRTCSSPADQSEVKQNQQDQDVTTTHSVEVQTDRSTLSFLKQDKKFSSGSSSSSSSIQKSSVQPVFHNELAGSKDISHESDLKHYQVNEFECIRLKKTGFNYEYDKLEAKFTANMNTPELLDESDVDQPMDFALCYSEADSEESHKISPCSPKSDHSAHEKMELGKSKAPFSKETKNKKEMFSNPSKSFKEIFNFFKDRDKKKSTESTKTSSTEASKKVQKLPLVLEPKAEKSQQGIEQYEKEVLSRSEASCSQETPLMFSRCSSLSSLSGIEHISVNDDRSSVLSDISRRTSGVVSPSELPDSPAQSVSANSRPQQKSHFGFFGKKKAQSPQQPKVCPGSLPDDSTFMTEINFKKNPIPRYSVFEDNLTSFKDESTPTKLHSMAASSLSSLTIDDDDEEDLMHKLMLSKESDPNIEKLDLEINRPEPSGESNFTDSSSKSEPTNTPYPEQKENLSEEEEEDELTDLTPYEEQLLDECIRRGIAKWTKQNINDIDPFSWDLGLSCRATKTIVTSSIRNNLYMDFESDIEKNDIFINQDRLYNNFICDSQSEDNTEEDKEPENNQGPSKMHFNSTQPCGERENKLITNSSITYEEHLLDQCIRKGRAKITRSVNDTRPLSWDTNRICLITRTMGYPNRM